MHLNRVVRSVKRYLIARLMPGVEVAFSNLVAGLLYEAASRLLVAEGNHGPFFILGQIVVDVFWGGISEWMNSNRSSMSGMIVFIRK